MITWGELEQLSCIGFVTVNRALTVEGCNQAFAGISGQSKVQLEATRFLDHVDPDDRAGVLICFESLFSGREKAVERMVQFTDSRGGSVKRKLQAIAQGGDRERPQRVFSFVVEPAKSDREAELQQLLSKVLEFIEPNEVSKVTINNQSSASNSTSGLSSLHVVFIVVVLGAIAVSVWGGWLRIRDGDREVEINGPSRHSEVESDQPAVSD